MINCGIKLPIHTKYSFRWLKIHEVDNLNVKSFSEWFEKIPHENQMEVTFQNTKIDEQSKDDNRNSRNLI